RRTERPLDVDLDSAHFVLILRGRSLSAATVELCISVGSDVVYRQAWPARYWLIGSSRVVRPHAGDSLISDVAKEFFRDSNFRSYYFTEEYLELPWGKSYSNPYAPAAFSLKQYAYRAAHGL